MNIIKYLAALPLVFIIACSTLMLKPADFAWPVESVVKVEHNGNVSIPRYSLTFNAKALFLKETGDSLGYQNQKLNVIRGTQGYYFLVANNFKNVYVFKAKEGTLSLDNRIEISDSTGIQNPAFNQRPPYIQLIYGNNKVNLNEKGIVKEGK